MKVKVLALFFSVLGAFSAMASEEYDACYEKARDDTQVGLCMKAETARLLKQIQEVYVHVSQNEQTKGWNKGQGLQSGNLKDMYDSWLAYRNRYCSLFTVASANTFGSTQYNKERCLLNITNDHYEMMKTVIINANTGGEEDD